MRIKITKGGIFNAKGEEIAVGTELDVKNEPTGWAGRYETITSGTKGKTAVTNDDLKAVHHGGGKFNIVRGKEVLASGLSKEDAATFNSMSDEDKAAYADTLKKA